jgi:hypothetical protein
MLLPASNCGVSREQETIRIRHKRMLNLRGAGDVISQAKVTHSNVMDDFTAILGSGFGYSGFVGVMLVFAHWIALS